MQRRNQDLIKDILFIETDRTICKTEYINEYKNSKPIESRCIKTPFVLCIIVVIDLFAIKTILTHLYLHCNFFKVFLSFKRNLFD